MIMDDIVVINDHNDDIFIINDPTDDIVIINDHNDDIVIHNDNIVIINHDLLQLSALTSKMDTEVNRKGNHMYSNVVYFIKYVDHRLACGRGLILSHAL